MIPRTLRTDPRVVLAAGTRPIRLPWASVRYIKTSEEGGVAVVVSKKVAKLAVDRHRAKRRVGAALLATRKPGYDVVVTLMAPGAQARGVQLKTWCIELWDRILEGTHA